MEKLAKLTHNSVTKDSRKTTLPFLTCVHVLDGLVAHLGGLELDGGHHARPRPVDLDALHHAVVRHDLLEVIPRHVAGQLAHHDLEIEHQDTIRTFC